MKNKKRIVIGVSLVGVCLAVAVLGMSILVGYRLFGGFDASKYVNAVCAQMLKGNVETVTKMTHGLSQEEAKEQREQMIGHFVNNVIASGLKLEKEQEKACTEIAGEIFSDLKYEVKKATKVKDGEYRVKIEYQKTDVMTRLQELAKKESELANQKADKGSEYRGTIQEINEQIQSDFAKKLPDMLEEAYKTMKFGEKETITLTVKKGENGLYSVDIGEFILKIMDLTAKQD